MERGHPCPRVLIANPADIEVAVVDVPLIFTGDDV